jgi:hypothetical protein
VESRTWLAPVVLAALLSGCGGGGEETAVSEPAPASSSATASPSAAASPSATPTVAPSPTPTVRTFTVGYAGGQVTGTAGREEVPLGEPVVLRISSDVPEEVHVHGYDLTAAVPAGGSVDITLTASIPGVFEVELHDAGKVLFQLRVA